MTTKLDQIYLDNLAVDEDDVIDIEALQEKARAEMQPTLFDLGAVSSIGYGPPPIDIFMDKEDKKFAKQIPQAIGKGVLMEGGGLVGDLLGIAKGLYNIPQDQMDELMTRIEDPTVQQKVISGFDSFMRGFDEIKELDLPPLLGRTSEAVGEDLTEMGFDPKSEADSAMKKKILTGAEYSGQIGTPGVGAVPLVKGVKKLIETLKTPYRVDTKNNILIDESGTAKTFYHGTEAKFNKFDLKKSNGNKMNSRAKTIYFSDDINVAKQYGKVKEVNLKMKKPFILDDFYFTGGISKDVKIAYKRIKDKIMSLIKKEEPDRYLGGLYPSNAWNINVDDVTLLKKKGYDGIIVPKEVNPREEEYFIVFDSNQIINAPKKEKIPTITIRGGGAK
tara:strand:+ start:3857 stop:5023 length:1167 start_codon:yes stop_codon:yes gene_type:complete